MEQEEILILFHIIWKLVLCAVHSSSEYITEEKEETFKRIDSGSYLTKILYVNKRKYCKNMF